MDIAPLILSLVIVFLLVVCLIYLIFYLPKKQENLLKLRLDTLNNQQKENNQQQINDYLSKLTSFGEQQEKVLKLRLEQLEKDLKNNKEVLSNQQKEINQHQENLLKLRLDSLSNQQKEASKKQEELLKLRLDSLSNQQKEASKKQEELLKLRLDSLGQELKTSKESLGKINNLLLAPFERGRLGNIQLDKLLSLYLPKDDKIYQLEYTLKKKTEKGEGLRPDAIVFGVDQKSNLAIDSKFPLDNYIASSQENLSEQEKEERIKKFKENIKIHIKKVAHYISKDDDIQNVIMFVPSEVIFAKINEQSYYDIIETALANKVYLCSPVTLAIIVNQVLWANKILEQYRTMDQVLGQLQNFWIDFGRWQDRWTKILKKIDDSTKAIREFNISVEKISKHGEKIKELKTMPQLDEKEKNSYYSSWKINNMKFKYDCLNNRFWKLEDGYAYEISEELTFTGSYGERGFVLNSNQPNQWINFTFYDRIIRVFYRQVSKVNGNEIITCYQKDVPKEVMIEFELTEKDIVMKRDDRWIKKNS